MYDSILQSLLLTRGGKNKGNVKYFESQPCVK